MRILLIKPPLNRNLFAPAIGEPLELEYLASAVREHNVEILDMRIDRNLIRKLNEFKPELVGITAYTCDANTAKEVLMEVKKYDINIKTAIGGHHPTFIPTDFRKRYIDIIFLGMSDLSFKKYIQIIENGGDIASVENIAFVKNNTLYFTQKQSVDINLDSLPMPDREVTRHYYKEYRDQMRNRTAFILTSKGCPFRCTFCACWKMMNGKYLTRSPESIVDELSVLPEDIDLVCFADDNTLHNYKRAMRLVELIKERNIRRKYSMYGRADTIVKHPNLIEELREAGLQYLTIGIESVEDHELNELNKKTSVEINNEAIRILQKLGINNVAHFIINPNYAKKDFTNVSNYVHEMNLFQPVFTVLTPLPGTELFTKEYDRLIIKNYDFFDFVHSVLPTNLS
ncbi:MAG: radical SAM protein, partial [bacterium]